MTTKLHTAVDNAALTGAGFDLARLIDPMTTEEFFRDYWEQKVLVVNRDDPDHFAELLTLDETDRVITSAGLRYPDISMVNAALDLKPEDYTIRGNIIDIARLYELFADGSTIILPQMHEWVPQLNAFCRSLELEISSPFQTNIYLTPGNAQGFRTHYDTHDVLVLQIAGSKHWKIYGTPVPLPLRGQGFDSRVHEPGPVIQEFDLNPGDMVYVPRGVMHDAESTDNASLHITVGVLAYSWTDLLLEAFSALSLRDPEFRRSLPIGFAHEGYDREDARETFKNLIKRLAGEADFDRSLEHFSNELISTRNPLLRGQMDQIDRLKSLDIDTVAGARPVLLHHINEGEGKVLVKCCGKEIALPVHAAETLRHALSSPEYRVGDLPGDLDDEGKLTLVRRLVREGLVMIL